ncbi:hypothetical protein C3L33_18935, partial [Rhododendron williamsianum]
MAVLPLLIFCLFFFLVSPPCLIHAQQPYVWKAPTACGTTTNNSNTVLGYTCNGLNTACQTYITFRTRSPYNTVSSVLNSDPSRVSRINSVPDDSSMIDTGELVVVPVECSCSGGHYYQSNTHYVVLHDSTWNQQDVSDISTIFGVESVDYRSTLEANEFTEEEGKRDIGIAVNLEMNRWEMEGPG